MKRFVKLTVLLAAVAVAAACANQKAPAEAAIKAAETAWAAVSAEALRYVPAEAKGIEDAIVAVKDEFTRATTRRSSRAPARSPRRSASSRR